MTMIINSVTYRKGERLGESAIDDIGEVVKLPEAFVWLGLYEPDDAMLLKSEEEFNLHELSIEDARNAHQRPKVATYGESMFIVLKTARLEEGKVVYGQTHLYDLKREMLELRRAALVFSGSCLFSSRAHV